MSTSLRPDGTVSAGAWRKGTGGTDLHTALDESSPDDADYVIVANAVAEPFEVSVGNLSTRSSQLTVRYRYKKLEAAGTGQQDLKVQLLEGEVEHAVWLHSDVDDDWVTTAQIVDSTVCAGIADFDALTVAITANPFAPNPNNFMTLTNVSGGGLSNYPLRFARVFEEGEIAAAPQVLLDGLAKSTGADVKSRWGDGSVKHAILSMVVNSLADDVPQTLTFTQQAESNTALTQSEMLEARFDFGSVITLTVGGDTKTASARTMLAAGHYTVWCANQIATTIILCDHSASATYDMTWSGIPARPIFHATFWNALNKVEVSAMMEFCNAEALGDLTAAISITKGNTTPTSVYSSASVVNYYGTRWIKRFWIGTAPETDVDFDHNLTYLKETMGFPNYDTTIVPDETAIAGVYTIWQAKIAEFGIDLYEEGWWRRVMGDGGGRQEIGPIPGWTAMWLYTGDHRMREIALKQSDLALAFPLNYRESVATKNLLRTDTPGAGTGLGLPISVTNRMTTSFGSGFDYTYTEVSDRLKLIGGHDNTWTTSVSHQPEAFAVQYALTGDPTYLEQMQFWAATSIHDTNGAAYYLPYGRGPTGAEGGMEGQTRAYGWIIRNRALAAFWTPDAQAMKTYLTMMVEDFLAIFEGKFNITGGAYEGTELYDWAFDLNPKPPNPLHFMEANPGFDIVDTNPSEIGGGIAPWMAHFCVHGFAVATELGFNAAAIRDWIGLNLIGIVTDPDFNPYMAASYNMATADLSLNFFTTWQDVFDVSPTSGDSSRNRTTLAWGIGGVVSDLDHDYGLIAASASSHLTGQTGGAATWAFCEAGAYDLAVDPETNPKWFIRPRT